MRQDAGQAVRLLRRVPSGLPENTAGPEPMVPTLLIVGMLTCSTVFHPTIRVKINRGAD